MAALPELYPELTETKSPPDGSRRRRLPEQVLRAARVRHLSGRTEKAYVARIRRFILFHGKRHPRDLGPDEVS